MSEKFEKAIKDFYATEPIADTKWLNLKEEKKISNQDLSNNLDFCIKYVTLFAKGSFKHFHKLSENQKLLQEKLEYCENELRKTQKDLKRSLALIENSLAANKPLTKKEVQALIHEITQQPKIVEEQALRLTAELEQKVSKVEDLIQHLIKIIS